MATHRTPEPEDVREIKTVQVMAFPAWYRPTGDGLFPYRCTYCGEPTRYDRLSWWNRRRGYVTATDVHLCESRPRLFGRVRRAHSPVRVDDGANLRAWLVIAAVVLVTVGALWWLLLR